MRVLFIAAVLGTLAQPAWAFWATDDDCTQAALSARQALNSYYRNFNNAAGLLTEDSNFTPPNYDNLMDLSDKKLRQASDFANIYQAFCKD